jgi:hypothetical protein
VPYLSEQNISCPYCGESLLVLVDPQDVNNEYIEDCQVCCRPIIFYASYDDNDEITVWTRSENE